MLIINSQGEIIVNSESDYNKKVIALVAKWERGENDFEIFTSGSTGQPKQITHQRNLIIESIKLTQKAFSLNHHDTFFCCLNAEYIAGMMMIFRALYLRTEILIIEPSSHPFEEQKVVKFLQQKSVFYAFVPLQIENLLNPNAIKILNQAKAIMIGGAAVNQQLKDKIQVIKSPVYATYGMTETITHIAIQQLNGEEKNDFFEVLDQVQIRKNKADCLEILAPSTSFKWISTNDLVEIADNQHFRLLGRKDNIINSGGVKIQLEKVEQAIEKSLLIKVQKIPRFFAWGLPDEQFGQKLVIFAETNHGEIDFESAYGQLSKFEKPKKIIWVEQFIETSTAKIDKIKTANEYLQHKVSNC